MREVIMSPSTNPGSVGRFTDVQLAQRSTWRGVPDEQTALAAMHVIHVVPQGGVYVAAMNPLEPATIDDRRALGADDGMGPGWLERPHGAGHVTRA